MKFVSFYSNWNISTALNNQYITKKKYNIFSEFLSKKTSKIYFRQYGAVYMVMSNLCTR